MLSFESVPRSMWNRQRSSAPALIITRIGARTSSRMELITGAKNKDEGTRMKDEAAGFSVPLSSSILPPSSLFTYRTCPFFDWASPFFSGFWYVRPADGDFTSHG